MLASHTGDDRDGDLSRTEKRNRKKYAKKKEREKIKSTTTRKHLQAERIVEAADSAIFEGETATMFHHTKFLTRYSKR